LHEGDETEMLVEEVGVARKGLGEEEGRGQEEGEEEGPGPGEGGLEGGQGG